MCILTNITDEGMVGCERCGYNKDLQKFECYECTKKEKDNSLTKKITEFKASLKPKSDKKEKEIFFTDIKNDDEELAKEIEDVFNNNESNKNKTRENFKIKLEAFLRGCL